MGSSKSQDTGSTGSAEAGDSSAALIIPSTHLSRRQLELRDPLIRPRHNDAADPIPLEEAVLEPRADSMRDMVRSHLADRAAFASPQSSGEIDEDFLDDDDLELHAELNEAPLSDYQLHELAAEMQRRLQEDEEPFGSDEPSSEPVGSETSAEGAPDST